MPLRSSYLLWSIFLLILRLLLCLVASRRARSPLPLDIFAELVQQPLLAVISGRFRNFLTRAWFHFRRTSVLERLEAFEQCLVYGCCRSSGLYGRLLVVVHAFVFRFLRTLRLGCATILVFFQHFRYTISTLSLGQILRTVTLVALFDIAELHCLRLLFINLILLAIKACETALDRLHVRFSKL